MRYPFWLAGVPLLIAATCNPTPDGGALLGMTIDELGPLLLDETDSRFTDSAPSVVVTLTRQSDGAEGLTTFVLHGTVAGGFNLESTGMALTLPPAPCDDTREMTARFRLTPGADWAESVGAEYAEESADLLLLPGAEERVELWAGWQVMLTPDISFPTERIQDDELPLGCV